jgi:photosystem II stability/assembly factor-like uncharacterized protein
VNELIRSQMHAALDVVQPDPRLRSRVMASLPVDDRQSVRFSRPPLEWMAGAVAVFLAIAIIASLLYVRGGLFPIPAGGPHEIGRAGTGMVSPTTGWAFSVANDHLIRTGDGGRHWIDVTPAGYVQSAEPAGQFFLDSVHAAITQAVYDNPSQTPSGKTITVPTSIFVLTTSDAGRTWRQSNAISALGLDREPGAISLQFVDTAHGWMLMDFCCGPSDFYELYRTTDGGIHWSKMASIPELCSGGVHPFRRTTFVLPTTGWMTTPCASDPLLVSHDAGASWASQVLPVLGTPYFETGRGGVELTVGPAFVDQSYGVFVMNAGAVQQLLGTADGGTSWSVRSLPGLIQSHVDFVDANHGWVLVVPTVGEVAVLLYRTDDGGKTWVGMQANLPVTTASGTIDSIQFVDRLNGFAIRSRGASTGELWRTIDSGHTWTLVGQILRSR